MSGPEKRSASEDQNMSQGADVDSPDVHRLKLVLHPILSSPVSHPQTAMAGLLLSENYKTSLMEDTSLP